jgi:hypothetical protein
LCVERTSSGLVRIALGEPEWSGLLYVLRIELDERNISANYALTPQPPGGAGWSVPLFV